MMGVAISVKSTPSQGSVFTVRLEFRCLEDGEGDIALVSEGVPELAAVQAPRATSPLKLTTRATTETPCVILVAEDNPIDREVIERQLRLLGFPATIVHDGLQALERWREGKVAMLLTDLRMPEMDGYALVAAIRNEEGAAQRTPIVALTANALPEEERHCRDAGMDDYLVKPVRLKKLKAMIERWIGAETLDGNAAPSADAVAEAHPADLRVLSSLVGEDPADIAAMLRTFQTHSRKLADELLRAVSSDDSQPARESAHKLKSAAFSIGAQRLGELCERLEQAGRADRVDLLKALLPQALTQLEAVYLYLDSLQR